MKHIYRFIGGWLLTFAVTCVLYGNLITSEFVTPAGDTKWTFIVKFAACAGVLFGLLIVGLFLTSDITTAEAKRRLKAQEEADKRNEPIIIGNWKSDIVEERRYGKSHYRIQNIEGLKQILDRIGGDDGRGGATINWWVAGQSVQTSAYVPVKLLIELKEKANDNG